MAKKTQKKRKHVPQRTCVGCRTVQSKRSLIRLVRTPQGVQIDQSGRQPGRGAYLHDLQTCWVAALKGPLSRSLKIALSQDDRDHLLAFMETLPAAIEINDNK